MGSKSARAIVITVVLTVFAGGALLAHDFWIQPSSFTPPLNVPVRVRFMVGDHFAGEPLPRNGRMIERFFSVGPTGETKEVVGADGVDPAGIIRFETPGLHIVGYDGRPSAVNLEASAFEAYLKEEGLERISRDRVQRGESGKPGREQFSRSVKTFIRAGSPANSEGFDRAVGLPLEIVPEADPFVSGRTELPVRLLFDGQPLEGALLVVMKKNSSPAGKGEVVSTVRSDETGRAVLTIAPGVLLIKAVHMVRAQPAAGADWSSTWTSLTFETSNAGSRDVAGTNTH